MDRSLQGLPPIRRSKGPHSASCNTQLHFSSYIQSLNSSFCQKKSEQTEKKKSCFSIKNIQTLKKKPALTTHVFARDGPNVVDVLDLSLVLDHPHGDGIVAYLRGDVALDLKAKVSEHQVACRRVHHVSKQASER